jgi:hypothetical protein
MFDTLREWWNGTSDAKDVSSYAQSTNGDYSPVSMLKQSAAATATPPANTVVQPVVLQNQLPEGMISLTISLIRHSETCLMLPLISVSMRTISVWCWLFHLDKGRGLMPLFVRNKIKWQHQEV